MNNELRYFREKFDQQKFLEFLVKNEHLVVQLLDQKPVTISDVSIGNFYDELTEDKFDDFDDAMNVFQEFCIRPNIVQKISLTKRANNFSKAFSFVMNAYMKQSTNN